ncbi:death-associated protein kinase related-like isoform X1 [Rhopalosiphum padi]|uniref:death-associated protein kinase related-like isoform X1 n=2 Tax=Rhopalosiphum padi TaxID=40932 RepID=UPI00298DEB31|nr:death-associated protein kinase related-like isoform X1 [Rhopalosiphum padi]
MLIYPTAGSGAISSRMNASGQKGGRAAAKGAVQRKAEANKTKSSSKQTVLWKHADVEQGVVVVDEKQLMRLVKTEPIENYYRLDSEPFAKGQFASVRRCTSIETGEVFAAKFSNRTRFGEDCSPDIHHEIALLSLCSPSPRITKLHDVFQTPKQLIIVMEYAPGGDLQKVIDDDNVPFEADVVKFIHHVVEGLAYMHQRKIAHLDIKPQNLVLMGAFPTCDVKLCDFEISRVILEGTEIREILGTPDYVAPEILHYEPITLAADMWSLGVTTYALLTGFSPFGGDTDQETFCNISNADIDFPDELFEDVSEEAVDFIRKLLVKDPRERLTAKECLKHPWLANLRRSSSGSSHSMQHHQQHQQNYHQPQHQQLLVTKRAGCNTCAGITPSNGARRGGGGLQPSYLSKSREALFERIVTKHMRENDMKRSSMLHESQYASSRMCESHTSLVSRSRHGTRTFSKSKEKLYGLKSLSRSQDVLDMCKSIKDLNEVDKIATVGSLLMSLTGVSTLPNSLCSSTINISVSQSHIPEGLASEDDKDNCATRNGDRDTDTANTATTTMYNSTNINTTTPVDDITVTESNNYTTTTTATTTTTVTSSPDHAPRSGSPAGSSTSGTSSVEHFYHSDEEPRFSVAQLVKAFDTHQEVVTKRSLEVTMNPVAKLRIAPATTAVDQLTAAEFPTGPNALRLFIPNIDICGGESAAAKRTRAAGCTGGTGARDGCESARSPNSDNRRKRSNVND